jgi:uncharacterized membrane protein
MCAEPARGVAMNQHVMPDSDAGTEADRNILLIAYVLYALGPFTIFSVAIAGVIINHLKINETHNHFIRSHHRWLMRTFWFSLLWSIIGIALILLIVGYAIGVAVAIWYIYRVIRGALNFSERKPMPMA